MMREAWISSRYQLRSLVTVSLGKICKPLEHDRVGKELGLKIDNKEEYEKLGLMQMMGANVKWDKYINECTYT